MLAAQEVLVREHGVRADVWSVTSYVNLRRDGLATAKRNRHTGSNDEPYIVRTLGQTTGPVLATSDWMRALPDQIAPWLPGRLTSLGTDGFGLSDTRESLRRHFEVDAKAVVSTALWRLGRPAT